MSCNYRVNESKRLLVDRLTRLDEVGAEPGERRLQEVHGPGLGLSLELFGVIGAALCLLVAVAAAVARACIVLELVEQLDGLCEPPVDEIDELDEIARLVRDLTLVDGRARVVDSRDEREREARADLLPNGLVRMVHVGQEDVEQTRPQGRDAPLELAEGEQQLEAERLLKRLDVRLAGARRRQRCRRRVVQLSGSCDSGREHATNELNKIVEIEREPSRVLVLLLLLIVVVVNWCLQSIKFNNY